MTKFGVSKNNLHILRNIALDKQEHEDKVVELLDSIQIKPVTIRQPNHVKPLKMLHEVQQEAINLYEQNKIQQKIDIEIEPETTDVLTDEVGLSGDAIVIPSFITHLNDIKISDENDFLKFKTLREKTNIALSELTQRINGISLTLTEIYKNKLKLTLLYETFVKCRRVIELDVAQIELVLFSFPAEVSERVNKIHGNFCERTRQQLRECSEVNIVNLKRLYETRAYLHQVFESIFLVVTEISKECSETSVVNDKGCTEKEENKVKPLVNTFANFGEIPSEPSVTTDVAISKEKGTPTKAKDVQEKTNDSLDLDSLLYPKLLDYNFSYQFNRDALKQMLDQLIDEPSKQQFINDNDGKSRQILNKEIVVEINRLGGFDLHLKTIQPILKRLFPRPDELDPESRSLSLIKNWGAFQYYCENLIDAVKKLFYSPIPDRDIVTPVLSHYMASLAICNLYFRIFVQHFIVNISEFHLFEMESTEPKTSDMDTMKLDRLDNVYHFMAYLYLTPSGVGLSESVQLTCFGLRNAWYVLAKVANSNSPYVELKIVVVYRFLQICGFAMMVFFQNQFVKLLNYIIIHCMPIWKKNMPDSAYPFFIRLHDLINEACLAGIFDRPKYLNKKIFPYLNRTNIPKFNDRELFCIKNFRLLYD